MNMDKIVAIEAQIDELRRQIRDRSDELARMAGDLAVERARVASLSAELQKLLEEKTNEPDTKGPADETGGEDVRPGTE